MRAKADEEMAMANGKSHHEDFRLKYKTLKKKLKFLLHVSFVIYNLPEFLPAFFQIGKRIFS